MDRKYCFRNSQRVSKIFDESRDSNRCEVVYDRSLSDGVSIVEDVSICSAVLGYTYVVKTNGGKR